MGIIILVTFTIPNIPKAAAATVTIPIAFTFLSGSDTFLVAGVNATISGSGCTGDLNHNGTVTKNFVCNESVTITVTMPTDASTSRFRFSDGTTTKTFTSCAAPGPCSTQTFSSVSRQFFIGHTITGIDAAYTPKASIAYVGTTSSPITRGITDYHLRYELSSSQYVAFGDILDMGTGDLSICNWIWIDTQNTRTMVSKMNGNGGTVEGYTMGTQSTGKIFVRFGDGSGSIQQHTGSGSLVAETWSHVCIVFDRDVQLSIYINGVSDSNKTGITTMATDVNSSVNLNFGRNPAGASEYLRGLQDDVRIYNRTLSASEVSNLYNGKDISSSNLRGWWKLNDGTGTSATDSSGNGLTGTLTNGPFWEKKGWADQGSTLTIASSITVTTNQERFANGNSTAQRQVTVSAASNKTYVWYHQYGESITSSGIDASRTLAVTRTQNGSSGTSSITGNTATVVWADNATSVTVPSVLVVTANQERFQSYNSTASLTFTASSSLSKTYVFKHEFVITGLTFKDTSGSTLNTQPVSFTFTSSNGTAVTSFSATWITNGTATVTAITWNGLNVTPATNTIAITSTGAKTLNTDIGITSTGLFQVATDQATSLSGLTYDSSTAILQFTSDASGLHDTVVEYSTGTFDSVRTITVDGVTLTSGFVDSTPGYLEISDTSFSSKTFAIQMNLKSSGGGGGSGGGGADSGTGGGNTDTGSGGQIVDIRVTMPEFTVMPGESQTKKIIVQATGHTKIIITEMAFDSRYASWFAVSSSFPAAIVLLPGQTSIYKEIPLTMTVPENTEFQSLIIPTKVTATVDALPQAVEISQVIKANIGTGPTGVLLGGIDTNLLIVVGFIGLVAAAAYSNSKKRRR